MNILQINDFHPQQPGKRGGCEIIVESIESLLSTRNHRTHLLTSRELSPARRTPLDYIHSKHAQRALASRLRSDPPDVVLLHNFYHRLSPAILQPLAEADIPTIAFAHDAHLLCPNPTLTRYQGRDPCALDPRSPLPPRWSTRWDRRSWAHSLLRAAQHAHAYDASLPHPTIRAVLAPSEFLTALLRKRGYHAKHIPLPAPPPSHAANRPHHPLALVFAGRIEPEKGLDRLVGSLPRDVAWTLRVIGQGSHRRTVERICSSRNIADRVTFEGQLSRAESQQAIATAHALVLPSVVHENSPLVILEAIAAGTAPVVTQLGGAPELAALAPTHAVFNPLDPTSIDRTIRELAATHDRGSLTTDHPAPLPGRSNDDFADALLAAIDDVR